MATVAWMVAFLSLELPGTFRLVGNASETVPVWNVPGAVSKETRREWEGPDGEKLHVFVWEPHPSRDRGAMIALREWDKSVAGETARVAETKVFMGREQAVLSAHLRLRSPESVVMIYASGMSQEAFETVLESVSLRRRGNP